MNIYLVAMMICIAICVGGVITPKLTKERRNNFLSFVGVVALGYLAVGSYVAIKDNREEHIESEYMEQVVEGDYSEMQWE